jgi:hypothetical protein
MRRSTVVSIEGEDFYINGQPTYAGRQYRGHRVEGLLMNARMVQATFDDLNPETRGLWNYPDGAPFDADRNTDAFVAQVPAWCADGLLAVTLNLQGGSPQGYSREQPWVNTAIREDGSLRPDYMARLGRVLDALDAQGMVAILGLFYFGQDERVRDEAAVCRAVDAVTDWLLENGYGNVLVEIANECDIDTSGNGGSYAYQHSILTEKRGGELIHRVQERSGRRLLVSTSFRGGTVPTPNVAAAADFLLIHGNSVPTPDALRERIDAARAVPGYRGQPVVVNEDDHFDFEKDDNHLLAAVEKRAGWGYFDYRMAGEGFEQGYQSVPTDWGTNSERKRGFFRLLREVTGAGG